ncbi:hypothetical protein AcV5_004405 [Taiwanofungus camphoratus]|nr:hypothetical protein AcV5_004405 [Antrodia cinnamomea]KAI0961422.1 hypothetical protein AcV7_000527 [Antrodia cinnamomea]
MANCFLSQLTVCLSLTAAASLALADSNDWVNVNYVLKQTGGSASSDTANARQGIINSAGSSAKSGPWSIVTKGSVAPPSGDAHDYLSWAPYHWPNCNWCSKGTTHLGNPGPDGSDSGADPGDDSGDDPGPSDGSDPYDDSGSDDDYESLIVIRDPNSGSVSHKRSPFGVHHRMMRVRRARQSRELPDIPPEPLAVRDILPTSNIPLIPTPTVGSPQPSLSNSGTSSSHGTVAGTPAPAQAPAKTQGSQGSCTPSPTKSLAPSATWTTCPYEVHDGKLNPDVRTLPDSPSVVSMSQSVLYNSLAYALSKSKTYSQNAATFIDTFFLSSATAMHPNMNYGQLVRGPGKDHQIGTFTGILDLRGLVKVVNGIQLLKATGSPDWTSTRDNEMLSWMNQYLSWLQNSDIGKETASKANNHFTFYVNQLTAAKIYSGDTNGAISTLQGYFTNQFLDQVAASGEQPFEAVRTRPYHYRCFNLEAMITNAKMGDQLGLNLWSNKSKYGATIQTALDYTMGLDPKDEDVSDIFPHVAAVAAAYGDPKGKYAAFLQKQVSTYQSMPFWFYDQTSALPNSPAAKSAHTREIREDVVEESLAAVPDVVEAVAGTVSAAESIPFACPEVFASAPEVEIEDGLFVTCDELKPFYEIPIPLYMDSS